MAHIDLLQNDIATNPQSGYYRVYFKSDGFPYYRNNAGTETAFTVGSLSDYVTIATPQTITGAKTFSSAVNLGSVGSTTALTPLAVDASGNVVNGSSLSGGQVDSVVGGTNINITTPGVNPTVNLDASISNAITSNTTNIATNATNIASNDTDIATNATNIATNTTNIATNVTAIATNATDIAANTTLANSKLASVVAGTNVTITGTATNPIVNSTSVTPSISLQDAYDDSTTPEITTDATRGAVSIKVGVADADTALEVQDTGGTNTFQITGEGVTSAPVFAASGQVRLIGGTSISLNHTGSSLGTIYADNSSIYIEHPTEVIIGGGGDTKVVGNLDVILDADIGGTLDATGNTTVNTFIVNGTATLNSTLDVTGTIKAGGSGDATKFLNGLGAYSTPSGGSGDVVGPSGATDTAIAVYDSTSGKLIKNSGVLIDASNNVTIPGQMSSSKIFLQALGSDPGTTFTGDIWRVGGDIKAKGNIVLTNDITAQGDMFANDITASGTIKAGGSGDATKFLNGLGAYTTPSGGGTASPVFFRNNIATVSTANYNTTTFVEIPWNGTSGIKSSGITHGVATGNPEKIFVDADGQYDVYSSLYFQSSSTQRAQLQLAIFVNGQIIDVAGKGQGGYARNAGSALRGMSHISTLLTLSANDYIEIRAKGDGLIGGGVSIITDQSIVKVTKLQGAKGDTGSTGAASLVRTVPTTTTTNLVTDADVTDIRTVTALASAMLIENPTGTPINGQVLKFRIKDSGGSSGTISYGSEFSAFGVALPTTITSGKTLYLGCIYNSTDTTWDVVASVEKL